MISLLSLSHDRPPAPPSHLRGRPRGARVGHAWLVNPLTRILEVLRLGHGRWTNIGTYSDEQEVRAEPFEAIVLALGLLWANVRL